jgi:hypothetical protein
MAGVCMSVRNLQVDEHYAAMHSDARPGPYVVIEVADTGTECRLK